MSCEIEAFEIKVVRHPQTDNAESPTWLILIQVKFKSPDPKDWGELRAYAAQWTRTLNRSYEEKEMDKKPALDPTLKDKPRITELDTIDPSDGTCPPWDGLAPKEKRDKELRLHPDQHIEIFYAGVVPNIPRSDLKSQRRLSDDDNPPNNIKKAERPNEIELTKWHIVGRDEPTMSLNFQVGDYVEFWHQAEFQVRVPKTVEIVAKKRLFCRVQGLFPNYSYTHEVYDYARLQ